MPKRIKLLFMLMKSDPKFMNMALKNMQNVSNYYADKGEKVIIKLVAYGRP